MAIDNHTITTTPDSTAAPTVDPAPTEPHIAPDSDDASAAPSLKLDIPSAALPSSPAVVPSEPPSPVPLAPDAGSGSTTTDTAASSASPHTSLSASPSLSSSASSLPPPPLPGLSVKFAPLPQLAPRKRRSAAPLGMAARGQLVRGQQQRRRAALAEGGVPPPHAPLPPEVVLPPAQLEALRLQQEAAAARYAHLQGSAHALAARETEAEVIEEEAAREARAREKAAEREREKGPEHGGERDRARGAHGEEDEDPLLALGKAVKGVGRFWRRRVASRDDADASLQKDGARAGGGVVRRRKSDLGRHTDASAAAAAAASSSSTPPPVPPMPLRPILANITTNITPGAPLPQLPLEGEHVDREEDERTREEDERIQDQTQDKRDRDAREQKDDEEEEEQGGVWEEEIGDGIPLNAGQTQTIVGGRVVASVVSVATVSGTAIASPTTTTTTTIEVTATATATAGKAHGKKDGGGGAGKKDGAARLVKSSMRSSLIRRGKAQVGGAQA